MYHCLQLLYLFQKTVYFTSFSCSLKFKWNTFSCTYLQNLLIMKKLICGVTLRCFVDILVLKHPLDKVVFRCKRFFIAILIIWNNFPMDIKKPLK